MRAQSKPRQAIPHEHGLQWPPKESRVFASPMNFLPFDNLARPAGGAYRRKFALSQNSKSLPAGSNPSERTLIIPGIVMASNRPSRSCDTR